MKNWTKLMAFVTLAMFLLALAGCKTDTGFSGKYQLIEAGNSADVITGSDLKNLALDWSLEFKTNGTVTIGKNGTVTKAKYTIKDNLITVTVDKQTTYTMSVNGDRIVRVEEGSEDIATFIYQKIS